MSQSVKQTPLGINALGALLQDKGLMINPIAAKFMGVSKTNTDYTPGTLVTDTCLSVLTSAINLAYNGGLYTSYPSTYDNLIQIGKDTIPALGNAKPKTYDIIDPRTTSNKWTGVATTGYYISGNTGQGQAATWLPYDSTNPNVSVTQWGYIRLFALQAWNEFNWNGIPSDPSMPEYKDFCASFMIASGYAGSSAGVINTTQNSKTFLKGTYSNMNDLISSDITGVNLATAAFGYDCIQLGKAIDLSKIYKFGMPSALLQTIKNCNALTQALTLALLSANLTTEEIGNISNNTSGITKLQEQKIYSAFLIITGQDLMEILIPLNCKVAKLDSLADLLNPKKIFPKSYYSLTVPVYNTKAGPTNSKTYYPIYEDNGISSRLTNAAVVSQIGTILLPDEPPINDVPTIGTFTVQKVKEGFDSYLDGIIPTDIALAAGAFSFSMQQINNIKNVDFQKFAQVVFSLETTKGLADVNGTDVPVNLTLANEGQDLQALGSGPYGTYTMSDFFGCMSGLPYMWQEIQNDIIRLQTNTLKTIYDNLYYAVDNLGGLTNITDVQNAIDQANIEIAAISTANPDLVKRLNVAWNATGTQLTIEQRARWNAMPPVPSPTRNVWVNVYPTPQNSFVDAIGQMAQNTLPHMQAQTLEAISDLSIAGGQSIVAAMRQERNQSRLQKIGIELDNTITDTPDLKVAELLAANGTAPVARPDQGIKVPGLNGTIDPAEFTLPSMLNQLSTFPVPSPLGYFDPNTSCFRPTSSCIGGQGSVTDPATTSPIQEMLNAAETNTNSQNLLGPARNGTGPAVSQDMAAIIDSGPYGISSGQALNVLNQSAPAGSYNFNQVNPVPGIVINTIQTREESSPPLVPIAVIRAGSVLPTGSGKCLDQGGPMVPGSLAGSPDINLIPTNLSPLYTSNTLLPSVVCVPEAIEDVIKCNCDCWVN